MMNYVFAGLVIIAAVWSGFSGSTGETAAAVLSSGRETVELMLTLTGAMAVWSGLMAVAEASGVTRFAARLLRPAVRRLLPGLQPDGEAERCVCVNLIANLLGLGNAATPPALRAMQSMRREQRLPAGTASREMMTFAVMNTASLQLLPTTLAVLRSEAGSPSPMDILPCVWITSAAALTAGLLMCRLLGAFTERRERQ